MVFITLSCKLLSTFSIPNYWAVTLTVKSINANGKCLLETLPPGKRTSADALISKFDVNLDTMLNFILTPSSITVSIFKHV